MVMYSIVSIPRDDPHNVKLTQIDTFSNVESSYANYCRIRNELIVMNVLKDTKHGP